MPSPSATIERRYERYWQGSPHDPLTPRRLQRLWQLLEEEGMSAGRLLDVGCGAGALTAAAAERGYEAEGMDLSRGAVARASESHPGLRFHACSAEAGEWPGGPSSWDVVVSLEVIEHLFDPRELVAGAQRALRSGGWLVLSTPYHGLLKNLALSLLAFDRHFDVDGEHIRFFSDRALRSVLSSEGFERPRIAHLGRLPGIWSNTLALARKPAG